MILTRLFIVIGIGGAALIALGSASKGWLWFGLAVDAALLIATALDYLACPAPPDIEVARERDDKLSLGAENVVRLKVRSRARRAAALRIRDEIPAGFGADPQEMDLRVEPNELVELSYHVTPHRRGDHHFGDIYVRSQGPLGLVVRQSKIPARQAVRVYPNLLEAAKYELLVRRGRLLQTGVRPAAMMGVGTDFESLREYLPDDEYRRIDWKATARRGKPITRIYQTERSQNVIIVLDTGRTMCVRTGLPDQEQMTKLDHAVNAALLLAYVASRTTDDRVGLMTFADQVTSYLPPRKGKGQIYNILKALYALGTTTMESDYAAALRHLASRWRKRSLVVVFTDLPDSDSSGALVSHMATLARTHLCLCVAVADPAVAAAAETVPETGEEVYRQAVAREIMQDRNRVRSALLQAGVSVLDVRPEEMSPALINRYLGMKLKAML